MLARKKLIPLTSEFERIRKGGKVYDAPSFGIIVSFDKEIGPKCAFIVSKKISKSSVTRHECKRKLSNAVSGFLPRLSKNVEIVFLAKTLVTKTTQEELKLEVESVFRRAKLI